MSRGRPSSRGFTLLEAMVVVVVGGATVLMAAKLASVVIQQNGVGRQKNDLALRARILAEQMQGDVRLAGMGSTGAIGVDPSSPVLGAMATPATPVGGNPAIPAIAGANMLPAQGLATGTIEESSDALQVVVPNPGTLVRTTERVRVGTNVLPVLDATPIDPVECDLVYIHDHTNPNAAGRTQIAWLGSSAGTQIVIDDVMVFTAAAGTEVMCARISTYWVDADDWLHRTDIELGGADQLGTSRVWVSAAPTRSDLMAPGVEDMQIAYKVSAEAFRLANPPQTPPTDPDQSWLHRRDSTLADGLFSGAANAHLWFEIRMVRVNLYARRQNRIAGSTQMVDRAPAEDGEDVDVVRGAAGEWITFSEAVTNLRLFDSATGAEAPAEPY